MKEIMEMYSSALNSVVSIGIIVPAVVKKIFIMLDKNIKINWMAIKNGKHDYFSFEKGVRYAIEFID